MAPRTGDLRMVGRPRLGAGPAPGHAGRGLGHGRAPHSVAVIIAVGVNTDGRREVLGIATGASEAEPFWTAFLRSLADRGLRGVKLVIADDHKGLRAAATKVFHASHQRCRERLGSSPIREGWISRTHFVDACASLWLQGELRQASKPGSKPHLPGYRHHRLPEKRRNAREGMRTMQSCQWRRLSNPRWLSPRRGTSACWVGSPTNEPAYDPCR